MTGPWRVVAGLPVLAAATWVAPTRASPQPTAVLVTVPADCPAVSGPRAAFVELLRVELAADGVRVELAADGGEAPQRPQVAVAIEAERCDSAATRATIMFWSGAHVQDKRTVPLKDIAPVARPRALAMTTADLVRTGLQDMRTSAAASASSAPNCPDTGKTPQARPASTTTLASWAAAEARIFAGGSGLAGARLGLEVPLLSWLALDADAGISESHARDVLGDIDGTVAALGVALLAMGGGRTVRLGVGPRVEGGIGWFHGGDTSLAKASSTNAPLLLLAMSAMASFPVRGPASVFVGLDAGASLYSFSAKADQRVVTELSGPMAAVRLGASFDFWAGR